MRALWLVVLASSLSVGLGLGELAPARWGWGPAHSLILGVALYFGALHRYVTRSGPGGEVGRVGSGGFFAGLTIRAAAFLAVAGSEAVLCFEVVPGADLRAPFIVATTWLAAQAVIDPPRSERAR